MKGSSGPASPLNMPNVNMGLEMHEGGFSGPGWRIRGRLWPRASCTAWRTESIGYGKGTDASLKLMLIHSFISTIVALFSYISCRGADRTYLCLGGCHPTLLAIDCVWLKKLWVAFDFFFDLKIVSSAKKTIGDALTISSPPTNSPPIHSCGKVGQSANSLSPCLTSSSARMLKNPYLTPFSLNNDTNCRENPHSGADGVPFMNSMTGAALTKFDRRVCKSSFDSSFDCVEPDEYAGAVAASDDFGAYEDRSFVVVGAEPLVS